MVQAGWRYKLKLSKTREACQKCLKQRYDDKLSYAWIFNEYPSFVEEDSRRFVSQETGHLYISKVEPSDVGNYTCVVTSMVTNARVLGSPTPLVLRSDGNETSPSAILSANGAEAANKNNWENFNGVLEIPNFQQEDAGSYECIAENSRGKNVARGRLTYYEIDKLFLHMEDANVNPTVHITCIMQCETSKTSHLPVLDLKHKLRLGWIYCAKPHWVQLIKDVEIAVEDNLYWECRASGKPKPSYRWLKNGAALVLEWKYDTLDMLRLSLSKAPLLEIIDDLPLVLPSAPDFSKNPMKKLVQVQVGSLVSLDCKPRASPRARSFWKKGDMNVQEHESKKHREEMLSQSWEAVEQFHEGRNLKGRDVKCSKAKD
ncbi:hypothetical protein P7K49_030834 [Saguinus oedipus]|uniref:Ig-like domain-containing protein n=1 Tax=Saguinus oedipus TaxID=9490 RepID=A0ABQ9U3A4_SAGOE|nr:hypothetical protein P7K49_030834 [Saguinus oedipus]